MDQKIEVNNREYLGTGKHGFEYYLDKDRFVYSKYPNEYWVNGENKGGEWVGWVCSFTSWDNTLHRLVE